MNELSDAVLQVGRDYESSEYIRRVKTVVAERLQKLDPTVKIEDTHYFNHSAIPDFVFSWSKDSLKRYVYLRGSYASLLAADDIGDLVENDPIFLALDSRQEFPDEPISVSGASIRQEASRQHHTLLTDVSAVGNLGEAGQQTDAPIISLVQANFIRGARGFVDDERAGRLVSTESDNGQTSLSGVLRETFSDETFTRMERTAAIVDLAVTSPDALGQVSEFELRAKLTGRLSDAEISSVIPWIVRRGIDRPPSFWRQLGSLFSFEQLENIASLIDSVDISPLVRANSAFWQVRRSYVGSSDYTDLDRVTRVWSFRNGTLTVDSDYHRVFMASHGRSLRGREGSSLPRWSEVSPLVADFRLQSVDLRGVARSIRVDAEQSDDIRSDVQGVTESLDDDYRVASLVLRFPSADTRGQTSDAQLDLGRVLAIARDGVTIEEMLRSGLRVLAHRNSVSPAEVVRIVSDEAQPAD